MKMAYVQHKSLSAIEFLVAIKSTGAVQIYSYAIKVDTRSFMSSVVRDNKKSIGLLPEAQLKWLLSRGGLIVIVCPNCDEHGWLRVYDYRTFKMVEEKEGAKSI